MFVRLREKFLKSIFGVVVVTGLAACGPSTSINDANSLDSTSQPSTAGIIGGQEVRAIESPALTSVIIYDTGAKAICTGSLLGNNIVLTAAHCLGQDPRKLVVVFSTNIGKATKEMARQVVGAVANPLWKTNRNKPKDTGDIAIIKYTGTTPPGYRAATLLPNLSALKNGSVVVLAGYGISDGVKKTGAGVLRQVMTMISNAQFSSTEIQLEQRQGRGACHGDSGGPAYILSSGTYYLWGITSRGDQDKQDHCNVFSLYTNLLVYYKWIQDTARSLVITSQFSFPQTMTERVFGSGTYY
jgi:secreted trypsin-like serine protease